MKLEQSFEVDAPLESVWSALIDVQRVAPCLPGAEVHGQNEDGSFLGSFAVKLGPATASYRGTLHMDTIDESSHTATMHANGTDKRGQGGAKATIVSSVRPRDGGGTHVDVSTDYSITGRLARFGRGGMIQDVSERLLREFAACLQSTLAGERTEAAGTGPAAAGAGPTGDAGAGTADGAGAGPGAPDDAPAAFGAAPGAPATGAAHSAASPGGASGPERAPSAPPRSKPVSGFRLLLGALMDRLRRWRRGRAG